MIDQNEVQECLREWLNNPYWAEYYEGAPSEECKRYIELDFYYSDTEDEEAAKEMDAMEGNLTVKDWKWLLKYSGDDPNKARIMNKIRELGGK